MNTSNLDSLFKNNEEFEKEGIWFSVSDTAAFRVRRFGGYNSHKVKAAMARHYKPYARMIELGTLGDEKERDIMLRVFIESSIVGWRGIQIDGKDEEFSIDAAFKLLKNLPDLADSILAYASESKNYREELGNS